MPEDIGETFTQNLPSMIAKQLFPEAFFPGLLNHENRIEAIDNMIGFCLV